MMYNQNPIFIKAKEWAESQEGYAKLVDGQQSPECFIAFFDPKEDTIRTTTEPKVDWSAVSQELERGNIPIFMAGRGSHMGTFELLDTRIVTVNDLHNLESGTNATNDRGVALLIAHKGRALERLIIPQIRKTLAIYRAWLIQ